MITDTLDLLFGNGEIRSGSENVEPVLDGSEGGSPRNFVLRWPPGK
jgi:hypothetical protein